MYVLAVSDHMMVAHSFRGAIFGPAQKVHGATFVVEWEVARPGLDEYGLVADIGAMRAVLRQALDALDYRNLDDLPEFAGRNTTTEVLAGTLFERLAVAVRAGALGPGSAATIVRMKVTLRESPVAWASYEAPL